MLCCLELPTELAEESVLLHRCFPAASKQLVKGSALGELDDECVKQTPGQEVKPPSSDSGPNQKDWKNRLLQLG